MAEGSSKVRWIVRIVFLASLAFFFYPLYLPPTGSQPASTSPSDKIVLTFYQSDNANVYQKLTLLRDGTNTVEITRKMGDPDLPPGGGWNPTRVPGTEDINRFRKDNVLDTQTAKTVFNQAVMAGVLDLKSKDLTNPTKKLIVEAQFGSQTRNVTGPSWVANPYHWFPPTWVNNIHWQKVILLVYDSSTLRELLSHKDIELVNE